jgi:hypothetical protein
VLRSLPSYLHILQIHRTIISLKIIVAVQTRQDPSIWNASVKDTIEVLLHKHDPIRVYSSTINCCDFKDAAEVLNRKAKVYPTTSFKK